jgi:hypothetical protein
MRLRMTALTARERNQARTGGRAKIWPLYRVGGTR